MRLITSNPMKAASMKTYKLCQQIDFHFYFTPASAVSGF